MTVETVVERPVEEAVVPSVVGPTKARGRRGESLPRARARVRARETDLYCVHHGRIDLSQAILGKGGRARCPHEGCKRWLSRSPPSDVLRPDEPDQQNILPLEVAGDSEVLALVKKRELTKLRREIRELEGPLLVDQALARIAKLESNMNGVLVGLRVLHEQVNNTLLAGVRDSFRCSCGSDGYVMVRLICAACRREVLYGWSPPPSAMAEASGGEV